MKVLSHFVEENLEVYSSLSLWDQVLGYCLTVSKFPRLDVRTFESGNNGETDLWRTYP
jgi:hypothetical protein